MDQSQENQITPGQGLPSAGLFAEPEPLLAELVFYGAHNYGNYALCGKCGETCGREGCRTCDESGNRDGENCEDCLDGERFWCDHCGEIEGWLPKGQHAPIKSSANASDQ